MRLGHLLEAGKPTQQIRADLLKLQQELIDNEYNADLDVKMNSAGGLHVTLPNFVDELIWHNAHAFMARSGHQQTMSNRVLGASVGTALSIFLPDAFGLKLKQELYSSYGSRHDIYLRPNRADKEFPIALIVEWDGFGEKAASRFRFKASEGIYYGSDFDRNEVPLRTCAEVLEHAKMVWRRLNFAQIPPHS